MFSKLVISCAALALAIKSEKYSDDYGYELSNDDYSYAGDENYDYDYDYDYSENSYDDNSYDNDETCTVREGNYNPRHCWGTGDPHVYTWDHAYYHPQGHNGNFNPIAGWYRYVATCHGATHLPFVVSYYYWPIGSRVAGTRGIKLRLTATGTVYQYKHGDTDRIDGNAVSIHNGINIFDKNGKSVASIADCAGTYFRVVRSGYRRDVQVIIDGVIVLKANYWQWVSQLFIDTRYNARACGLCGKLGGGLTDEFELCNGQWLKGATPNIMRQFLRQPAMTLTREFTASWSDSNTCKHEPPPEPIPAPSPKICSNTQKQQCQKYCETAYDSDCSRCRRLGRRFQDKVLKSCKEDMEVMDGCDGAANGKAVAELKSECKRVCG